MNDPVKEIAALRAQVGRLEVLVRQLQGDVTGDPNGQVTGSVGDTVRRRDGGAGTAFYVKESGVSTNTGWVGK